MRPAMTTSGSCATSPRSRSIRRSRMALPARCVTFVSGAAHAAGIKDRLCLKRQAIPGGNVRKIGKRDMIRNSGTPQIEVNPETFAVTVDGIHATVAPLKAIALDEKYFFSCGTVRGHD